MTPHLHVAHRHGNDLELLVEALGWGADLIEADVHLHRGRLEVRHTKSMGPLPWLWDRWYVVSARDARLHLHEVAAKLPPERRVMLDLKGWQPWLGRRVLAAMAEAAPGVPYTVCSRHWRMLDAFEGADHVHVVHSVRSRSELARLPRRLASHGTWGIAVHRDLLAAPGLQALRGQVDAVLTWPVNTDEVRRQVLAQGATGIISDELR